MYGSRRRRIGKSLPSANDLHVSTALTMLAIAWKQEQSRFVAGRVFPEVPVDKPRDQYYIWEHADFFRDEAEEAAPGAPAPIQNLRLSQDNYQAKVYHLKGLIREEDLVAEDEAVSKEEAHAMGITNKLLIRREKVWATNYFTTGKWTGSTTATDLVGGTDFTLWSNYATSDPVIDIMRQIVHMEKLGVNRQDFTLTVGAEVWFQLENHPKFLERYEQTQTAILNEQLVAAVLGIKQVVVPKASENTAAETKTAVMAYIQGKSALLTYSPPSPSKILPSAGYHFTWRGLIGSGNEGIRMRRWWDNDTRSWKIQGETAFDPKLTSSVLGVFFSAAVA